MHRSMPVSIAIALAVALVVAPVIAKTMPGKIPTVRPVKVRRITDTGVHSESCQLAFAACNDLGAESGGATVALAVIEEQCDFTQDAAATGWVSSLKPNAGFFHRFDTPGRYSPSRRFCDGLSPLRC